MLQHKIDAITVLAERVTNSDLSASSHWQLKHRSFSFDGRQFQGLNGFGSNTPRSGLLRRSAHYVLQTPFRRMGRQFPTFEQDLASGYRLAIAQDRQFELGWIRHVVTTAMLRACVPALDRAQHIVVIGDGFATMTVMLLATLPHARVTVVNLTRTLLVDLVYLARAMPELNFALVDAREDLASTEMPDVRVCALEAQNSGWLADRPIDLAINMTSMQEMNPETIDDYFRTLRAAPTRYFYCCNRVEKVLPDGTVTRFVDYPWRPSDQILFDELCPWQRYFYSPKPPFYPEYNGQIQHRLVKMHAKA